MENKKKCDQMFGRNWKTATVMEVVTPPKGSGKQASVVVDWLIGEMVKRKDFNIGNFKVALSQTEQPERDDSSLSPGASESVPVVAHANITEGTLSPNKVEVHGMM